MIFLDTEELNQPTNTGILGFSNVKCGGMRRIFIPFFILLINFHKEKSRVKMSNMTTLLIIDSSSAE